MIVIICYHIIVYPVNITSDNLHRTLILLTVVIFMTLEVEIIPNENLANDCKSHADQLDKRVEELRLETELFLHELDTLLFVLTKKEI